MRFFKSLAVLFGVLSLMTFSTHSVFTSQASVVSNEFSTGTWQTEPPQARIVINEVYYDVAPGKGGDGAVSNPDEWIELYNAGNAEINIKNWTIADNTTTRTINGNHIIAAGSYALIAKDSSTWSLYWTVPAGTEIINLGQIIGGGLSNAGDRVILKDDTNNIIDRISYGTDVNVLDPSIIDVVEGHSISRNPAGLDTDSAYDFIDQIIPTPGI